MWNDKPRSLHETIHKLVTLDSKEWTDFSRQWQRVEVVKNEYLTQAGQVEKYFYFVEKGVVRGFALNNGEEVSVGFSYNGEFTGAYDSFLSQSPTDLYIQALSTSSLLKIHYDALMSLFDQYKNVERWGRIFNANILIGMGRRQVESRSFTAEEKFKRLMQQSPHILQLVPQKYLASYLGMTPETFSRLRKNNSNTG